MTKDNLGMTRQEKLIRAREAAAAEREDAEWSKTAAEMRAAKADDSPEVRAALRALNDLDKPIPDADEAWRPFLVGVFRCAGMPVDNTDRDRIARIKAARHLMPPEERS